MAASGGQLDRIEGQGVATRMSRRLRFSPMDLRVVVLAAAFERPPIRGALVYSPKKRHEMRTTLVEPGARDRDLERKAHLNIRCGEVFADEPGAMAELGFEIVEVQLELRPDE